MTVNIMTMMDIITINAGQEDGQKRAGLEISAARHHGGHHHPQIAQVLYHDRPVHESEDDVNV